MPKKLNIFESLFDRSGRRKCKPYIRQQSFSIILFGLSLTAQADSLPQNILKQLPRGYKVMAFESGELNDDKLTDYLVALHKKNEKEISESKTTDPTPRRPLLIFIQNTNKTFTLTKRNDNVIYAIDEGGQCDPFMDGENGFAIKNHYFTVQNNVACGSHWSDYITFHYDPKLADWVFHKRIQEDWVMNNSTKPNAEALVLGARKVSTGKNKAPVLFEKYRPN
jgi:hypothetical protein